MILKGGEGEERSSEDPHDRYAEQKSLTHDCILPGDAGLVPGGAGGRHADQGDLERR